MSIAVKIDTGAGESELALSSACAAQTGLTGVKTGVLCFGNRRGSVTVVLDDNMPQKIIRLSNKLIETMHIPVFPRYEIRVNGQDIIIGPVIGLLVSKKGSYMTETRLQKMLVYVRGYDQLHGAVIAFALKRVKSSSQLIKGYCYNPETQTFQEGIYPYPSAIFRTVGLSKQWKKHFRSAIGDTVFNSDFFSKWSTVKWLSNDPEISRHLPKTVAFLFPEDVFKMLEQFGAVYIKPIHGLRGRGIVRVSVEDGRYVFRMSNIGEAPIRVFSFRREAAEFICRYFSHGHYLVQQAVGLIRCKGGVTDFRCIMQKNQACQWECKAIIGRYGRKNGVVSNLSSGGRAFRIENIGRMFVPLPDEKIRNLASEMRIFAVKVCAALDRYGPNCGNLGLDIGVDRQGYLWLIEINNRDPDPSIAYNIGDEKLYFELKSSLLFYAKALAGFKKE